FFKENNNSFQNPGNRRPYTFREESQLSQIIHVENAKRLATHSFENKNKR
ncbi:hypothetical protein LINGRAHAP2_LOCUS9408, partial [Linum grandiflorum]